MNIHFIGIPRLTVLDYLLKPVEEALALRKAAIEKY